MIGKEPKIWIKRIFYLHLSEILENMQELKVIELFAGVGGFRIGLEKADSNFYRRWI